MRLPNGILNSVNLPLPISTWLQRKWLLGFVNYRVRTWHFFIARNLNSERLDLILRGTPGAEKLADVITRRGAVVIIIVVVDRGEREERQQAWQRGARGNDFSNSAAENGRKGSFRMEMTERGGEGSPANPLKSRLSAVGGWETDAGEEWRGWGFFCPGPLH